MMALLQDSTVAAETDGPFKTGIDAYQSGDYVAAFKAWLPLAHSGDPAAQRNLGHLYRMGLGVGQDFSNAVEWYKRAAESGLARAQANLGNAYLRGQGVAQNYRKARMWFERAAAQGHTISQYNLALMYESGLGMDADDAEALIWFYLASKGGHNKALRKLAHLISQNAPVELASLITGDRRTTDVAEAAALRPAPAASDSGSALVETTAAKRVVEPAASKSPPLRAAALPALSAPPAVRGSGVAGRASAADGAAAQVSQFMGSTDYSDPDERRRQLRSDYLLVSAEVPQQTGASETISGIAESRSWWARLFFPDGRATAVAAAAPDSAALSPRAQAPERAGPAQAALAPSGAVPVVPASAILDAGLMAYRARDYRTAMANWLNLAEAGNHYAQFFVGGLYADGAGVPRDVMRAAVWWTLAANQGHDKAPNFLDTLKPELTAEETGAANLLVRSWSAVD